MGRYATREEELDKLLPEIARGINLPDSREVLYYWERKKDSKFIWYTKNKNGLWTSPWLFLFFVV